MVDREKGSNSLRGGKNIYSARSKLGNWVEEEYKPGIPTRGFSTRRFVTTSATQQLEGAGRSVAESEAFGAGVEAAEPRDRFDYADIIHPDTTQHPGVWSSVTKSMHKGPDDAAPTEFSTTFKLKGGISNREELQKYREEWSSDTPLGASMRFKTSQNAATEKITTGKFKSKTLRKLPGTPLAVERLRQRLLDERGFEAMSELKKHFKAFNSSGDGGLGISELKAGLKDCGIALSDADGESIFKYFDKSGDGIISLDEFATCLRGGISPARVEIIKEVFEKLDVTGDGLVKTDDLAQLYDLSAHPDVVSGAISAEAALSGILEQWDIYENDGTVTLQDFIEYYHDIGASIEDDVYFEWMMRAAWKVGPSSYVTSGDKSHQGQASTTKGF